MAETIAQDAAQQAPPAASVTSKPHTGHKHHQKKESESLMNLTDADLLRLSQDASAGQKDGKAVQSSTSLLTDLILTPLHLITFVVSLSMIDYRQRQWRLSQRATDHDSFWFRLTHWSWLHPEPYQDSRDGTWKHNPKAGFQQPPNADFQGWSTQKKHRAITKLEVNDAFEMRGRVFVALLAWTVVGAFGLVFATKRLYGWVSRS